MGKGYVFRDSKRDRATTKATKFIRDVGQAFNRRCSIVGVVQNKRDDSWICTVDVCGPQDVRIDVVAKQYK